MSRDSLLIVGIPEEVHVGAHLREAANELAVDARILDSQMAFQGPRWLRRIYWWLLGRRPLRLREFSARVLEECRRKRPAVLLATGLAPLDSRTLECLGRMGVRLCNYLTDDPWNPAHRAPWFLKSLPFYHHVFSTRCANLDDLRRHGCRQVSYLPFAYSPSLHQAGTPISCESKAGREIDLIFAGGADADRVPYLSACINAGFKVQIYGGYWERYDATRKHTNGLASPHHLRDAMSKAKVSLCLVRRANRDGHVMRTYELPALGVCMLTEETTEHRAIFGAEGENVVYFRTPAEAVDRLRWLIENEGERIRLASNAHRLIVEGRNTYRDRLETILQCAG